jgi:hypothetical protein
MAMLKYDVGHKTALYAEKEGRISKIPYGKIMPPRIYSRHYIKFYSAKISTFENIYTKKDILGRLDFGLPSISPETLQQTFSEIIQTPPGLPPLPPSTTNRAPLTFDDIQGIANILVSVSTIRNPLVVNFILQKLLDILNEDIELRKEKYKIDCIEELHKGEDLQPQETRIPHPDSNDMKGLISERLMAVAANEYSRLLSLAAEDFINKKITYEEYLNQARNLGSILYDIFIAIKKFERAVCIVSP